MRLDNDSDYNNLFLNVLEYIINSRDSDITENTITKLELEEKENDNMKEEIKLMKTLEACDYLLNNKDEYLVAKDNKNFELHYDGKTFTTIYWKDRSSNKPEDVLHNVLTLNYSTLNTEWVKVEKQFLYRISGYTISKRNKRILIHSEQLYLGNPSEDFVKYLNKIRKDIIFKHNNGLTEDDIEFVVEQVYDRDLEPITKMS